MQPLAGAIHGDELCPVDLPRGAAWITSGRRRSGKGVDALLALHVVDEADRAERARDHAGLLERLAARGGLEVLARIDLALGDAPRRGAVVRARRMNDEYFECAAIRAPQKGP